MASELLSFIIPAHNEERWIAACIGSIRAAMVNIAEPYEVIVVDDASTDATHQIAEQCGNVERGCPVVRGSPDPAPLPTEGLQSLRILRVDVRKISAVRNAGARAAAGDILWCPPNHRHWHGATPTTAMTHIAIQEELNGKAVEWMEKVTDDQYNEPREE